MRSPNIRYFPAVDHLRAYAALLIVFYHGLHLFSYDARFHREFGIDAWLQPANPLLAALAEGHTAVALFMVLSGFILTYGALDRAVDAWGFIRNRLLRTYPLFLLLVFGGIAAFPDRFTLAGFAQTVFGLGNLSGALVAPPFTSMLWTIAIEWQYYLLFPLLLAVLKTGWLRQLAGMLAVLLLFRAAAVFFGADARDLGYLTILGRLDQFLVGMCAAWLFRTRPLSRRRGAALAAGALVVAVAGLAAFNAAGGWPASPAWKAAWPTFEALFWAAFVIGYVEAANAATGAWSWLLARIGEVSYSIYLVHFVVIWALLRAGLGFAPSGRPVVDALLETALVALPITLAVASLTYRFVELPFLRLRGHYHRDPAGTSTQGMG
ncbi:MAG: acyltransferase family protein [Dokdonella sp.]|uniref:acyltransferase family protein n=1 Tax=Dokdonella sp. TaxID=2291710 RepID=UPI003F7F4379